MKPRIFKRGEFWWCKGVLPAIGRSVLLHGHSPLNAYLKFVLMRNAI